MIPITAPIRLNTIQAWLAPRDLNTCRLHDVATERAGCAKHAVDQVAQGATDHQPECQRPPRIADRAEPNQQEDQDPERDDRDDSRASRSQTERRPGVVDQRQTKPLADHFLRIARGQSCLGPPLGEFISGNNHAGDEQGGPVHSDNAGYFHAAPQDKGEVIRKKIVDTLKTAGIHFEKHHHEVTLSQHEINLEPADPLEGADRTVMFNYIAQRVAAEAGYCLSFMPKPFNDYNRNAFHIHLSVCDREGKNLFSDGDQPHDISELARHFIGGILKYARETSLIMASTYNSYKAYVLAREAPIVRGWGLANRSSMVRIPYSTGPASTRLELGSPDPLGNVYLQVAVLIAMGVQGVRENLDCGKPDAGSTYSKRYKNRVLDRHFLPKCLFEALMEAEKSRFLKGVLGEHLYDNYMALKTDQWEMHRTHVTGLEHRNYLDR